MKKFFILLHVFILSGLMIISSCQTDKRFKVLISTDYGDIKIVLYDETPQHRDNFIKLVKEGWYDSSDFHRVIKDFMIQGGHNNKTGVINPDYHIPAEFVEGLIHKRGAVAAARQNDQVNPQKMSSGSQFYIVQGKKYSDQELSQLEQILKKKLTPEQRELYKTFGGAAHLDGAYTVFGEVIEGMEVVDKIGAVQTGEYDRPLTPVYFTMKIVRR